MKMVLISLLGLVLLAAGCSTTRFNPKTGQITRTRFLTDSDIQGFLAENDPATGQWHVEWESSRSEVAETMKALVQYGVELGRKLAVLEAGLVVAGGVP